MTKFERKEWEMKKALLGTYNGPTDKFGEPPRKIVDDNGRRIKEVIHVKCVTCNGFFMATKHKATEYADRGKFILPSDLVLRKHIIISDYCDVCGPKSNPHVYIEKWW